MTDLPRKVEINIAAIRVTGFGGLCMVAASLACAVALPPTRWFMIAAIGAGIVFGVGMILIKRLDEPAPPSDDGQPLGANQLAPIGRSRRGPTSLGRLYAAHV